jgi:hypothetical protein
MPNWISNEPVLWIGLVDALIILAVTFGVHITDAEKAAIDGTLAAIGLLVTRSQVTANAKLPSPPPVPPTPPVPPVTP